MYSNSLVCDILEYIDKYLHTKISIEDFEHAFFYNRYYIMKLFKKEIGVTIFEYINKLRIKNSIDEINSTDNLMINIAINNGFYSLEYFSEIFKKEVSISPKRYQTITNNKFLSYDKLYKITNNVIKINKLIEYTNQYKRRRKPSISPVKSLSIFN